MYIYIYMYICIYVYVCNDAQIRYFSETLPLATRRRRPPALPQAYRAGTPCPEMCSGSEAGSYLRLIDFVYHSTLGLRVIKKKKKYTLPKT